MKKHDEKGRTVEGVLKIGNATGQCGYYKAPKPWILQRWGVMVLMLVSPTRSIH